MCFCSQSIVYQILWRVAYRLVTCVWKPVQERLLVMCRSERPAVITQLIPSG